MNTKKRTLARAVALLSGTLTGNLLADALLEEVVVTAQKREQSITDVSLSVSAFSGNTIRSMGLEQPSDLAFMVSNVDIKGTQGDINPAVTVRGIGMNNFNANNNPSVGIYVDEVFLSSPALMTLNMMDVERVEVLKGPQGTLYGRNSSGGALNIISAKPTQERSGYVSITAANYDNIKFEGAIGGGLTETLSGRVAATFESQGESYHETLAGKDFGDSDSYGLRAQLRHEGEALTWNLAVSHMDQDLTNVPFSYLGGLFADTAFNPCPIGFGPSCLNTPEAAGAFASSNLPVTDDPFKHAFQTSRIDEMNIDTETSGINYRLDYEFENVTLTSVTGYITQDRTYGENFWSTPLELFAVVHEEEIDQFSEELRFSGDSEIATWTAGIFYSQDEFTSANLVNSADLAGLLLGVNPLSWNVDQETTAWALFGSVDWVLTDTLTLVTGLRYSEETTEFKGGTQADIGGGTFIALTAQDEEVDEDNISGRISLEWRPTDDLLVYGSYSTGFKSGGFFGDFSTDAPELEPYDSEEVSAIEIGAKYTFADGRAQLDSAVFYYDYSDIQTFVPTSFGQRLTNIKEADITGIDLELQAVPVEGLNIRVGLGYLDTEMNDSFIDPNSGLQTFDGNELPNAAELQYTASVRYEFPISDKLSIAMQGDTKYTDDMFREGTNNPLAVTDSYSVSNARLSLLETEGTWELSLWVKNLSDEEYFQEVFPQSTVGAVAALPGSPRTYGLTLNYNFE